jgi:hypothetical protein
VKHLIISSKDKEILYLSSAYFGKYHDFAILKKEFPPETDWFEKQHIHIDLGFQGFEKEYKCNKVFIPKKKGKGQELGEEDKAANKEKSQIRIVVEHSIGGLKRFRGLSERVRSRDWSGYNEVARVCAGLSNYILKHPNS